MIWLLPHVSSFVFSYFPSDSELAVLAFVAFRQCAMLLLYEGWTRATSGVPPPLPHSCPHYSFSFLRIPLKGHVFQRAFLDSLTALPHPSTSILKRKKNNKTKQQNLPQVL